MLAWSNRWWVDGDYLFAGYWQEGREPRRGYSVRAAVRMSDSQRKRLSDALAWVGRLEVGTHELIFQEPFDMIRLTSSPTYALDYAASGGRRILISDFPVGAMEPVIAILNEVLPEEARIGWKLIEHPYRMHKRPNK